MVQNEKVIVSIKQGKLMGRIKQDINGNLFKSFQAIPYAKPPIGQLRFKPPEPALSWDEDILDCTKEKIAGLSRHQYYPQNIVGNEDCLYLNIYTPEISNDSHLKKYPVMFWIHGDAFIFGLGNPEFYGPEYLIGKKIVLVTINYRLGYLGYLKLHDPSLYVTGNMGLKDQVEALRWVKNNIDAFDGDPNNITLFGEGTGAASVHLHMMSPISRNLFHKAILQSGCALCPWSFGLRRDYELAKALGCKSIDDNEILNFLQKQSADSIFNNQPKLINPITDLMAGEMNFVTPVVEPQNESAFLWKHPEEIISENNVARVPLLIGYNSHEGLLMLTPRAKTCLTPNFTDNSLLLPRDLRDLLESEEEALDIGNKIKQFYYGNEKPSFANLDRFVKFYTDEMFGYKILSSARSHAQSRNQVYAYVWKLDTMLNIIRAISGKNYTGVNHGDELGYLFKNSNSPKVLKQLSPERFGVEIATTYWSNFAYTGNPNSSKTVKAFNVEWKPLSNNELNCLEIGYNLQHTPKKHLKEVLNLWDKAYTCIKSTSYNFLKILTQVRL